MESTEEFPAKFPGCLDNERGCGRSRDLPSSIFDLNIDVRYTGAPRAPTHLCAYAVSRNAVNQSAIGPCIPSKSAICTFYSPGARFPFSSVRLPKRTRNLMAYDPFNARGFARYEIAKSKAGGQRSKNLSGMVGRTGRSRPWDRNLDDKYTSRTSQAGKSLILHNAPLPRPVPDRQG